MTEIEMEELERKVTGNYSVIVEEARSAEALPDHLEDMRNVLPEMAAEEQADILDEEQAALQLRVRDLQIVNHF